ncbi:MAG: MFS transporter [Beijerinckiaceae bacterium]|nr:MFS transporter [Beijerinckiaceae bacterium]
MTSNSHGPEDDDRLSRHRPFLFFWFARVFSALGYQMTAVVVGWLVYEKTGSAYYLGLVGLCQFLPMLLLTFVVGHVADRFDRRRIVALCQACEMLILAGLALGAALDRLEVPLIFAAIFGIGMARAFEAPTLSAILPSILSPSLIQRAISISSSAMQTAMILGPSIGGVLYAFGVVWPLAVASVFFLVATLCTLQFRLTRSSAPREPFSLGSVFTGVRFIRSQPLILGTISLDLFAVLLGGITSLLPIFAKDILQTGPWGLGLLRAAPALGALTMSLLLTRSLLKSGVGMKMFLAVIAFGAATIVFSLSSNFILSFVALVTLGGADNISVVIRNSLVLLSTPDEMRGRVNSVNSLFIGTSNQVGDFESGIVAGLVGAVPAGIIGGVGTILIALLWMRMFPQLRRLDVLPTGPARQ